jgi:tripartite-type tricarboxylate transporter receptor subunit TctC
MRTLTPSILALLALAAVMPSAAAQTDPYPSRPITIIVPFPPGS